MVYTDHRYHSLKQDLGRNITRYLRALGGVSCLTRQERGARMAEADLRWFIQAITPILNTGLPISADEVRSSLQDLRRMFEWPDEPDKVAEEANKLVRSLLAVFPDDNVAPAAKILLGETKRSGTLSERRTLAARKLNIDVESFITNFEPYILNTLAEQLLQLVSQPDRRPQDRAPSYLAPKIGSVIALLLLGLAASQGWLPLKHSFITEGKVRVTSLILAVLTMALIAGLSLWRRARDELPSPEDYEIQPLLDPEFLVITQKEAAQHLSPSKIAIPLLVDMILSPSKYRMRIIESISLVGRSIRQEVKLELSFSDVRTFLTSSLSNPGADAAVDRSTAVAQHTRRGNSANTSHCGNRNRFRIAEPATGRSS